MRVFCHKYWTWWEIVHCKGCSNSCGIWVYGNDPAPRGELAPVCSNTLFIDQYKYYFHYIVFPQNMIRNSIFLECITSLNPKNWSKLPRPSPSVISYDWPGVTFYRNVRNTVSKVHLKMTLIKLLWTILWFDGQILPVSFD